MSVQCYNLDIDRLPDVKRAPCADCGSMTAPTNYGIFRRNMSLLYVRFGAKRDGNFCTRCAFLVSGSYNMVMLVCGWWGISASFSRRSISPKTSLTSAESHSDPRLPLLAWRKHPWSTVPPGRLRRRCGDARRAIGRALMSAIDTMVTMDISMSELIFLVEPLTQQRGWIAARSGFHQIVRLCSVIRDGWRCLTSLEKEKSPLRRNSPIWPPPASA